MQDKNIPPAVARRSVKIFPSRLVSADRVDRLVRRNRELEERIEAIRAYHGSLLGKIEQATRPPQPVVDPRVVRLGSLALRALLLANRAMLGLPARTYRLLKRRPTRTQVLNPAPQADSPLFTVIVPVYNHEAYLAECLDSIASQKFRDFECIVYDDASPNPAVRSILRRYLGHPNFKILFGARNAGISVATNRAIGYARGRYLAFVDCDDRLREDALGLVAAHLRDHPEAEFAYTDRSEIALDGRPLETLSFYRNPVVEPQQELLLGMYLSHLKVVKAEALHRVGLFDARFDSVQDYDFAFRVAETCSLLHIPHPVYTHRRHEQQTTVSVGQHGDDLADEVRAEALRRRRIMAGSGTGLVSIVILSLNRVEDTLRCLSSIQTHTHAPHEIILIDNGSSPESLRDLRDGLRAFPQVTLVENPENLGCGGGRNQAATMAKGEFLLFLDNDMEVTPGWLEHLLLALDNDASAAAVCCRVIFPNGQIQLNGGAHTIKGSRIRFRLWDEGKDASDLSSLEVRDCDWVPGGATLIRRAVFERFPYDLGISGAYEDNDWSLEVRKAGYKLLNAPLARVIHHHMNFSEEIQKDNWYRSRRYDHAKLRSTLLSFYRKHGLLIDDEALYRFLDFAGSQDFKLWADEELGRLASTR